MNNLVILGAQWGDEGKGKIVDALSSRFGAVVRFQGGSNAGHTVVVEGRKIVLHQIPSGIIGKAPYCVIGNGTVVDPVALVSEIAEVNERGVNLDGRFFISSRAPLVTPYHRMLDLWSEEARGGKRIGTTGRGIGPAYMDKVSREGLRAGDFRSPELLREKLSRRIERVNLLADKIYHKPHLDEAEIIGEYLRCAEHLVDYVVDTHQLFGRIAREGHAILFEGAQGAMLDIDHGTYPFVTSSSTTVGGVCTGTGLPPRQVGAVLGVAKAYCTRVGEGPFPSEEMGAAGEAMREAGREFGATTGRPRRCGWFDAVALRYAAAINGLDAVALMKIDVLDSFSEIKVCTGYELDGEQIDYVPDDHAAFERCAPVYETMPGWECDVGGLTSWEELPDAARAYVDYISVLLGVPIAIVSTGRDRAHTILRPRYLDSLLP